MAFMHDLSWTVRTNNNNKPQIHLALRAECLDVKDLDEAGLGGCWAGSMVSAARVNPTGPCGLISQQIAMFFFFPPPTFFCNYYFFTQESSYI